MLSIDAKGERARVMGIVRKGGVKKEKEGREGQCSCLFLTEISKKDGA